MTRLEGTVLVAWSHERIPAIAAALGVKAAADLDWPDKRFDLVWVFERKAGSVAFRQVP